MGIQFARTRPAALAMALALAGAGLTACGDDDDEPAASADVDLTTFCDSYTSALRAAIAGDADGEVAGLAGMIESGPAELAAPLQRFSDAIETDGQDVAHEELGQESLAEVGAVARTCDGEKLDLVAVDYGYEDVPDELSAGRHIVSLANASDVEEHEAIVLRKADGVSASAQELFQLPEEEVESMISPVAYLHAGNEREAWVVDLDPGEYVIACFLPVGGDEEAPPHIAEGMLAEFTVTE